MFFTTYPINLNKPGSVIPALFAYMWSQKKACYEVIGDLTNKKASPETTHIDLWLKEKIGDFKEIKYLDKNLSLAEHIDQNIKLSVVKGKWLICDCGKVEVYNYKFIRKLNLLDTKGRCKICKTRAVITNREGIIAKVRDHSYNNIHTKLTKKIKENHVFPLFYKEQIYKLMSVFLNFPVLLTRRRKTPYDIVFENKHWNLDPSIFNVIATWYRFKNQQENNLWLITGPSGINAMVLGLVLNPYIVNHLFIPRFVVNDWNKLLRLSPYQAFFLLTSTISWKKNRVTVNFEDLKFINKNIKHLINKHMKLSIESVGNLSRYNRNFLSKKNYEKDKRQGLYS